MKWNKDKVSPKDINNEEQFTTDDNLTLAELNAMVNNSFYAVDFAEAMADAPDISDAGNVGVPSVTFVDNIKDGKTYKKFKFSNLKGEQGIQGIQGIKGDKGDPNSLSIGSVSSGTTPSAIIVGNAPNQVLNLVLPKGEKGDRGEQGVQGETGKAGVRFEYDATTKTLNIITES